MNPQIDLLGQVVDVCDKQGNRPLRLLDNFVEHEFATLRSRQLVGSSQSSDAGIRPDAQQHRHTNPRCHAGEPQRSAHAQRSQARSHSCSRHSHHGTGQIDRGQRGADRGCLCGQPF
ncbi:hypothetical protein D3C72_2131260 [compost metagenome]